MNKIPKWTDSDVQAWKERMPTLDIIAVGIELDMQPFSLLLRFIRYGIDVPHEQIKIAKRQKNNACNDCHRRRNKRDGVPAHKKTVYAGKRIKTEAERKEQQRLYKQEYHKRKAAERVQKEKKVPAPKMARTPRPKKEKPPKKERSTVEKRWEAQRVQNAKREAKKALALKPFQPKGVPVRLDHKTIVYALPGQTLDDLLVKYGRRVA